MTSFICLLVLLQLKHWFIDFVVQLEPAAPHKFKFNDHKAIAHSVQHGLGTALAFVLVFPYMPWIGISAGIVDMVVHHVIDYGKTKIDIAFPWSQRGRFFIIGVDQLMHQFTYLAAVVTLLWILP